MKNRSLPFYFPAFVLTLTFLGASALRADNEGAAYKSTIQAGMVNQGPVPKSGNPFQNNNICEAPPESTETDPVDLSTGEFTFDLNALTLPGRLEPLSVSLRYHSQRMNNGHWGFGWFFPWEHRLFVLHATGDIEWRMGTGKSQVFVNAGSSYTAPNGHFVTLTANANGSYTITTKNRLRWEFAAEGVVEKFVDRAGNEINFTYETSGGSKVKSPIAGPAGTTVAMDYRLTRMTGTLGSFVDFAYFGASDGAKNGRVKQLLDSYGRTCQFDYDTAGNLISFTGPVTTYQNTSGSLVTQGRTTTFTYSMGNASTRLGAPEHILDHNLLTITDDKGQQYLANQYDANDRTFQQSFNGGSIAIAYTLDIEGKVTRADETDGNGVVRKSTFDASNNLTKLEIVPTGVHAGLPDPLTTQYTYASCCDQLSKLKLPRGNGVNYSYDAVTGNLLTQTSEEAVDSPNPTTAIVSSYTYESLFNQVKTMTDPLSRVTTYFYDYEEATLGDLNGDGLTNQNMGNVVKIVFPNAMLPDGTTQSGIEAKFRYNSFGQRTHVIQPEGNMVEYQYFPAGVHFGLLKKTIVDPGGLALTTEYAYDALDHLDTVKDPNGTIFDYTVNALGETTQIDAPLNVSTRMTYDGNGNLAKREVANFDENGAVQTPAWIKTVYQYDTWDRLTAQTEDYDLSGSTPLTRTTLFAYDNAGNLKQVTTPEGNKTFMEYDERNMMWKRRSGYQSVDEVVEEFHPDANGNTIERKNGLGKKWTTTFDLFDRPTEVLDPATVGNRFKTTYNKKSESTQRQTLNFASAVQTQTDFVWDELGRRTKAIQTDPFSLLAPSESRFFFDKNGRLDKTRTPKGHITDYGYDLADRLTSALDPIGNSKSLTYDANGNLRFVNETEKIPSAADEIYQTEYKYDVLNRMTEERRYDRLLPAHQPFTTYAYDSRSNLKKVTDALNKQMLNSYDLASRRRSMTQDATGISVVTQYVFDKDDRLTTITDADNFPTSYGYDPLDRLKTITYASGPGESFTYDAASNLKTHTAQDGVVTTLNYYDHNLLADRTATANGTTLKEEFVWGPLYLPTSSRKLVNAAQTSLVTMTYDGFGRLVDEIQDGATVHHAYDADHNLNVINYPSGLSLSMTHDALERLSTMSDTGSIGSYTYAGPFRVHQRTSNLVKSYGYDGLRRLTSLQTVGGLVSFGYDYDDLDRRKWEQRNHSGGTHDAYGYEGPLWLKEVWYNSAIPPSGGSNFQVNLTDGESRLSTTLSGTPTNYNAVDALHRYTAIGATSRVYDSKGNLTDDGTFLFEYDVWNRLTKVKDKATTNTLSTYEHDAMGRRTKRIVGSATSKYIYSGPRLLEESEDTGSGFNLKVRYVYGAGLDELLALDSGGSRYFAFQNGLGSTAAITTAGGVLHERYNYDAYGVPTVTDSGGAPIVGANGLPKSSINNQLWYTGGRFDQESGNYHLRARQYEPKAGQFVSRDPLGYVNGPNPYTYVNADPINFTDPMGLNRQGMTPEELRQYQDEVKLRMAYENLAKTDALRYDLYENPNFNVGDRNRAFGHLNPGHRAIYSRFGYRTERRGISFTSFLASGDLPKIGIAVGEVGGTTAVSQLPLAGLFMDIATALDPRSSPTVVKLALASALLNLLTLEAAPNFGASARAAEEMAERSIKNTARECPDFIDDAARAAGNEPNRIYSARELIRRAEESGPFHNFPELFNKSIFRSNRQVINDNYVLYTERGTINGIQGTFEIGVRPSASGRTEVILHRFFRPD